MRMNAGESEYLIVSCDCKKYMGYVDRHIELVNYIWLIVGYDALFHEECPNVIASKVGNRVRIHDASKYDPLEFYGYAQRFDPIDKADADNPEVKALFDRAWKHHKENNQHHPEYWNGYDMSEDAVLEMLCDWCSASALNRGDSPSDFYLGSARDDKEKNMSKGTDYLVEKYLPYFDVAHKRLMSEIKSGKV